MYKQRIISNIITGFVAGLLFSAVLLSNNTGFSLIDSLNITSLAKEDGHKLETKNYVAGKYGSIHTKRSTIRKFLRAHKTKRRRVWEFDLNTFTSETSDSFGAIITTWIKVNFVPSYLLNNLQLRGPPAATC